MIAINTIRTDPHYRRAAFDTGLIRAGYTLATKGEPKSKSDVLVLWNRQGAQEGLANTWESRGGSVLVCENGYCGKDDVDRQLYAISVHGHNGSGWFPVGDEDRFASLNVTLEPARDGGKYILVCGQRGIGSREMASPQQWEDKVYKRIKAMGFDAKIRRHPGKVKPATTLDEDLAGARMCVIWSSASGVKALAMGIPVVYCAPHWICEGAAGFGLSDVEKGFALDADARLAAMRRMAHAQWRVAEIESGEPFARIAARIGEATWQ